MMTMTRLLLLEVAFIIAFSLLGRGLVEAFGLVGAMICNFLFVIWSWQLFAFIHYRFCRQEEFLYVLETAAATEAPIESVLRAYLADRPKERLLRSSLLFFVFPGFFWYYLQHNFDARLGRLTKMLDNGVPLNQAIALIPGVVSRGSALAVTVGQFSGRLPHVLHRLPDRRLAQIWVDLSFRLAYPLIIFLVMVSIVSFVMVFIIPKFEKIFSEFRMKLPYFTEALIAGSRLIIRNAWAMPFLLLGLLMLFNGLVLSSRAKWSCPLVGWVYRLHARGQFLQLLGIMLETGKPLPAILDCVLESRLLPSALQMRVELLAVDLRQGQPLAESLAKHQLATEPMRGLIASAEKAQNLPWALQELGDSLVRRSAQLSYHIAAVLFPLAIFACACLIGLVAYAMFNPLAALIEGLS